MRSPKQILRDLVERWQGSALYYDKGSTGAKPGIAVTSLSKEDREVLSKLKAEDNENDRWPYYDDWYGKENDK